MLPVVDTRYAEGPGGAIAYQEVGEGPIDIVVAPGFVSHLDLMWTMPPYAEFIERLTRFARVVVFDKRGTGLSDPGPHAASFSQRMEDVELVMDAAGVRRGVLFGMSEGGPLTALYAAAHADRVEALVLYGTFARGAIIPDDLLSRFEAAVDRWGEGHTADIFLSEASRGPMVRRFTGLFERAGASPQLARGLLHSIRTADVVDVLPALDMPTLVLHRRNDPFASGQWSDEVAGLMPSARLVQIDGEDHLPWMGDAESVTDIIEEFATGRRRSGPPEKILRTILFTDIVDSTRQAAALGNRAWADMLRRHNEIVRGQLARFRGTEVKNTGDGFLASFSAPARAVRCAQSIAEEVRDIGIEVRCGLHAGEVEPIDVGDLTGIAVNIAARVNAAAGPSEVLASSTVRELTSPDQLHFASLGEQSLKGVPGTVELFRFLPGGPQLATYGERKLKPVDRATLALARRAPGALRRLASLGRERRSAA